MSILCSLVPPDDARNLKVGEKADLTANKDGGVIKEVLVAGEDGDWPNANDNVTLRYVGYIGAIAPEYVFDSSDRDGKDFKFQMARGMVVRGFELAVATMKKNEKAMIYLRPEYAFGRGGSPPKVPPNTIVIFETHLHGWEGEDVSFDRDRSVIKHVLKKGVGWSQPNEGCMITLHIKGQHGDRVYQDEEVTYPFGEGAAPEYFVPPFIEQLLDQFKKGEKARLVMTSKNCFGDEGYPDKGIPPNADLVYEVELIAFERNKDMWEMNNQDKLDQCEMYKQKGTMYFKRQEYKLAKKFYSRMVDFIEFDLCMQAQEDIRRLGLLVTGNLNLALVYLKMEKYLDAQRCCDKILRIERDNVKALFRRGQSYFHRNEYQEAKSNFERALYLDPDNKAVKNHITLCNKEIHATAGNERQLCQNMMSEIGKGASAGATASNAMADIGDWDNNMAHGMMTLEQESEAFGDILPQKGNNNHGNED